LDRRSGRRGPTSVVFVVLFVLGVFWFFGVFAMWRR
jgi:hypothetical protein